MPPLGISDTLRRHKEENMPQKACDGIRSELVECVLRSNCVLRDNISPGDCIRNSDELLPEQCRVLVTAFSNCKRGMLDMRKRFRGNNITVNKPSSAEPVADVSL